MPNIIKITNYLSIILLTLWSVPLLAAPVGTASFTGTQPAEDSVITITGSGFGSKTQAAPIIYDFSDKAYINGTLDNTQGDLTEGDPLLPGATDIYWAKPSSTSFGGSNVHITYAQTHRHNNIFAHYTFDGPNGFLGWPKAYGGTSTTGNHKKLYASWRLKPFRDSISYWRWKTDSIDGNFTLGSDPYQAGEKLIINSPVLGIIYGEAIWLDTDGWLHFIALTVSSSAQLKGALIEGVTSGATTTLPDGDEPTTFISPGSNKYIRLWEEQTGKTGVRLSWTQDQTTVAGKTPDGTDTHLRVGRWNHLEAELNLTNNTYRVWINNRQHKEIDLSGAEREDIVLSPSIAVLGFNGKNQIYARHEFGEIYMDNTPQRVIVANASTLNNATHTEIQLADTWSDGSVSFKLSLGEFKTGNNSSLYVYVFDENGVSNTTGMQICSSCTHEPGVVIDIN